MNLKPPVTADELLEMSHDGVRLELVRGELREMPPAGGEHGETTVNLQTEIHLLVRSRGLGRVFAAETGFLIQRSPDTVRAADCAFIRADRMPLSEKKFVPIVPDLVVETVSPHDSAASVEEKIEDWLRAGVRLLWAVDPGSRAVFVHRPGTHRKILTGKDVLEGENVLPGFRMEIARIWV